MTREPNFAFSGDFDDGEEPGDWLVQKMERDMSEKAKDDGGPAEAVCAEIQEIMQTYREQEDQGKIGTPGGLEHMGDVWRLFRRWDAMLAERGKR